MIDFTVENEIARTSAEVFSCFTDPSRVATWQINTVSGVPEEGEPLCPRSRLREVQRPPGGKEVRSLVG